MPRALRQPDWNSRGSSVSQLNRWSSAGGESMPTVAPPETGQLTRDQLLEAYRVMRTIREFEDRVHTEFATGEIPGFVHLYAGEEASATGVCMHLGPEDRIASTHRGHGHCIAKGVDVMAM